MFSRSKEALAWVTSNYAERGIQKVDVFCMILPIFVICYSITVYLVSYCRVVITDARAEKGLAEDCSNGLKIYLVTQSFA